MSSFQVKKNEEDAEDEDLEGQGEDGFESWDSYRGMVREPRIRSSAKEIQSPIPPIKLINLT